MILPNSKNHVSCSQHLELFENLNYTYIISMRLCNLEIKLRWNELLCSREIVNRYFESKECLLAASCKVLCELLREAKISVYVVERRLYNYNIDVYVRNVYR